MRLGEYRTQHINRHGNERFICSVEQMVNAEIEGYVVFFGTVC